MVEICSPKNAWKRPPFSEFAQISTAKRLKFSQNSADDTRFTQPGSENAILERNSQISNWICQRCLQKFWKQANSAAVQVQKPPSPPLRFGNTTANHPPSANCGFTLIGDQKQTLYHSGLHQSRSKEGKKELENKVHNHFEAQEKLLKEQKESEVRKGAVESNIAPHNKPAGNLCRDTEKTLKRKSEPGQLWQTRKLAIPKTCEKT